MLTTGSWTTAVMSTEYDFSSRQKNVLYCMQLKSLKGASKIFDYDGSHIYEPFVKCFLGERVYFWNSPGRGMPRDPEIKEN